MARVIYLGMSYLHCTKREMLHMTQAEFYALWVEYLEDHGQAYRQKVASIDDLP